MGTDRKASCPAQPGVARHLLPHPYHPPSHLPPEGGVDGKQGEQCHAGHSTADHKGDRGGARQLQGLGKRGRQSDGSRGWGAAAGVPSPSLTSCLGQTGTSICVTRTHRGGSLLPSHVHGADPVTYVDTYLCCHPLFCSHPDAHVCVHAGKSPTAMCHRCGHHPGGTDFLVPSHKYTYTDAM